MPGDLRKQLDEKDEVREEALTEAREIRRLSTDAVSALHGGDPGEAERLLDEAADRIRDVEAALEEHPDVRYTGFLKAPLKEYAEARALRSVLAGDGLPDPGDVPVPPEQFLQGVGETVGELRREALDLLVEDRPEEAKELLDSMDEILALLERFNYPKKILDIRRTRDLARTLVDKTRGAVARGLVDKRLERKLDEVSP